MFVAVFALAPVIGRPYWPYLAGLGLVISIVWFLTVRYFRRLADAKFDVIKKMEASLPVSPFELEHNAYKAKRGFHIRLTYLEMIPPLFFAVLCLLYIFLNVFHPHLIPSLDAGPNSTPG